MVPHNTIDIETFSTEILGAHNITEVKMIAARYGISFALAITNTRSKKSRLNTRTTYNRESVTAWGSEIELQSASPRVL